MRTKFGNKPVTIDGIKFHSMLEGAFYQKCKAWKADGKILDFQMQIPYALHGGIKYRLDFRIQTLHKVGFSVWHYVEVKGYWTAVAKLKRKLFEADYGKLEIHSAKEPWHPSLPS
jgi:hypothetical protein